MSEKWIEILTGVSRKDHHNTLYSEKIYSIRISLSHKILKLQPQSMKILCSGSSVKHTFTDVGIHIVQGRLVQYEQCQRCGLLRRQNR
jgi:hypothetical protein